MEIIPLESLMNARVQKGQKPASAKTSAAPTSIRIDADAHRMLRFVAADTGEGIGEVAVRFMIAGGLREAAAKAKP